MGKITFKSVGEMKKVAVIGAGTMGHGIAQVSAQAGFSVCLYDLSPAFAAKGRARIEKNLEKGVHLGKISAEQSAATLARIEVSSDIKMAVLEADMVIEAAPEKLSIKQEIFQAVTEVVAENAILATNTSSLSIASIAEGVANPERVIGLHFFNPVHIMKLVEIVRQEKNDESLCDIMRSFVERMGKSPIVVADSPGFASSRLGLILGLEAIRMLEEGVGTARDIDTAMKLGYGHPMGPLQLTDLVGLDIRLHIADYLSGELGDRFKPPALLRTMVEKGMLGRKSGQGFYEWKDGKVVS